MISLLTCLVNVVHLLGAPEHGPGGCDYTPVGIVCPCGAYFVARASLFVCLKDKTCPRAEGGQDDGGPAAWQLALSSRCPARRVLAPAFLVALRRAVRGQPARADAAPLSVQGLSFALPCRVSAQ